MAPTLGQFTCRALRLLIDALSMLEGPAAITILQGDCGFRSPRRQSATIEFGRELTMSVLKRRLLIMVAAAIISFVPYVLWFTSQEISFV
jgi:hypothetical protein